MRKSIRLLPLLALAAGCATQPKIAHPSHSSAMPFIGINVATLSADDRRTIVEASDDFLSVLAGKKPVHARDEEKAVHWADGGTSKYLGHGYKLTVLKAISTFGNVSGYAYGPIITFDDEFAQGNASTISDVRVYSDVELGKLLGER